MRFLGILRNLCLSLVISLMTVSLSACLSETANSSEQSSPGGTELVWFLWLLSDSGLCWWEMENKWMTLALLNNHSAPLWFHTPAVISVQVEPCKDISGVKLYIEMGRLTVWRQVETL